jgi:uncharacterized membrane protein
MSEQPPLGGMPLPPAGQPRPRASVSAAISWAFDRFKAQVGTFIALAAVVTVVLFLQQAVTRPIENLILDCNDPQTPGQVNSCTAAVGTGAIVAIVLLVVFGLIAFFAQIGVQRAAIRSTQGTAPSFAEMFTSRYLGRYILFTICYALLVLVGFVLCIIPGLIVMFLLQLGPYYVLDKGYRVGPAIKASFHAVTKNIGPALLMTLFTFLVVALGSFLFGVFTLVTLPFACLFTAHMYRQFNGEPVV